MTESFKSDELNKKVSPTTQNTMIKQKKHDQGDSSDEEKNDQLAYDLKKSIIVGDKLNVKFQKYVETGQFDRDIKFKMAQEIEKKEKKAATAAAEE